MKTVCSIFLTLLTLITTGCSNTRFLAEDQVLYNGREKVEIITDQPNKEITPVKMLVNSITDQKVNNGFLGKRILPSVGLWTYNYWNVEEKKKFGKWLHRKLSAEPILISNLNTVLRVQKIQNDLFDMGYFQTRVWATVDTSERNPKKAKIKYTVNLPPPTLYNQIQLKSFSTSIDPMINLDYFSDQIKPGDQYNLEILNAARNGLSRQIQEQGYFYFTPDLIELNADTTIGGHKLDLVLRREMEIPRKALVAYKIGHTYVHIYRSSDTSIVKTDTIRYEDLTIFSKGDLMDRDILRDAIYFTNGSLYSYQVHQRTITRLNSLGIFRYVRVTFENPPSDSLSKLLNVWIELDMSENINVHLEADVITKSTGYLGPSLGAGISHGNALKGAENMHLALKGGFEWQWGSRDENRLGTISYNYGIAYGLTFPRILLPGTNGRFKSILNQQTSMKLDLNRMIRTAYYSMFSVRTNLEYSWKQKKEIQHTFSPIYINSVDMLATTPAFDSVVDNNIYIRKSFEEQFIFGMKYDFMYDNTYNTRPRNLFFQTGISTSGNLIGLISSVGKDETERPFSFLNNIYSQYIKLTTDFRYYFNGYKQTLAMRFYAGVGLPYLNSSVLPYVEQFFSGGAYSVRGFTARTLGPGSYQEVNNSYVDQSGDVKLEANVEYRFVISKILNGALFLETGNIWLINEDVNRPGSKFDISTFYNQLAIGTGIGLRFDFNFFILRTDLGFPIRTPYVGDDSNWLNGERILNKALFYLAIGYPF